MIDFINAKVAELADAPDLGSGGETRGGSSPPFRTRLLLQQLASELPRRFPSPSEPPVAPGLRLVAHLSARPDEC